MNMADHHDESHETADDFFRLVEAIVSDSLLCLAIALGMDTGLFDVMISLDQPKTSQEIADAGKFKERYVRRWLAEMASADIISMNPQTETYWIPENHKPALRRNHKLSKSTMRALAIPMLSEVFHDMEECFKLSGPTGVPPERYSRFDEYLSGVNSIWFNHYLIQSFMPSVPGLLERLEEGICVLDVACGTGGATVAMARHFPNSQFYAFDICESAIRTAQETADEAKLKNAHMVCSDITDLPAEWTGKFQYIVSRSGIHDLPHPRKGLTELNRVLANDGVMSALEPACHSRLADNLNMPGVANLYVFSLMSCLPVSVSISGGEGLGAAWGEEAATAMLQECGLRVISVTRSVEGDITMHLYCQKKEAEPEYTKAGSGIRPHVGDSNADVGLEKAKEFSSFVGGKVGSGLVSLAIAMGLDMGLFDVMIALRQPKTCQEIADAGKFKERYVREWLAAMVCARIINMDTSQEMYWIPDHRIPVLQRGGKLSSAVMSTLSVPTLSEAYYSLVECFKLDGPQGLSPGKFSSCSKYIPDGNTFWSRILSDS